MIFIFEAECKKHPTLNKLIEQFKLEQNEMENLYAQLMSGDVYERDKRQVAKDNALKAALAKYDKENALEFLDRIASILDNFSSNK